MSENSYKSTLSTTIIIALSRLHELGPPAAMTLKAKIASGKRANGVSNPSEPYVDVDVFSELLREDEFNIMKQSLYDLAHGMGNNSKDVWNLIFNRKQMAYTTTRRLTEQVTLQRYDDFKARECMPWHSPPANRMRIQYSYYTYYYICYL
jgi:hypothetical protein